MILSEGPKSTCGAVGGDRGGLKKVCSQQKIGLQFCGIIEKGGEVDRIFSRSVSERG